MIRMVTQTLLLYIRMPGLLLLLRPVLPRILPLSPRIIRYPMRLMWGRSRLKKGWTLEEEKKLVSAIVDTLGTTSWASIAANIPGRDEKQCRQKWRNMSKKAAATSIGTWTVVEEENKLTSAVETFGTTSWATTAANVPGRNEKQCRQKW
jgi:hypothetical protein